MKLSLLKAVEEFTASREFDIVRKRDAQIQPYRYTTQEREACLKVELEAMRAKLAIIAEKYKVNIVDIICAL